MTSWVPLPVPRPRDGEGTDLQRRLERFRTQHAGIWILDARTPPKAWAGEAEVSAPTLGQLLDVLDVLATVLPAWGQQN